MIFFIHEVLNFSQVLFAKLHRYTEKLFNKRQNELFETAVLVCLLRNLSFKDFLTNNDAVTSQSEIWSQTEIKRGIYLQIVTAVWLLISFYIIMRKKAHGLLYSLGSSRVKARIYAETLEFFRSSESEGKPSADARVHNLCATFYFPYPTTHSLL